MLNDVDKLSREAQHSLRRTMEKYSAYCRLILCCNSSSRVTEAIRSRCLNVRINAPREDQVSKFLKSATMAKERKETVFIYIYINKFLLEKEH